MNYILNRLREPSSHASLAAIIAAAPQAVAGNPMAIASVIAGLIGILAPERKD